MASVSLIQKIAKLAIRNFTRDPHKRKTGITSNDYEQMNKLVNAITVADLNVDPVLLEDRGPYNPKRGGAPVTYMQIYEDADITICLFILKNGVKLPLHDHPNMNGILKVIHGAISVQSYTMKRPSSSENKKKFGIERSYSGIFPAVKHPCIRVRSTDPACIVTPDSHNLHEITTSGGVAAFLDILSPPYGPDQRNGEERECHYYEEIDSSISDSLPSDNVYLVNIPTPLEFWCDQAEYRGPAVGNFEFVVNGQSKS